MRALPLFGLILSPAVLLAQPPAGYYDPAAGLTGQALREALRDIIDGHSVLANSQLWAAYAVTDRKSNNKVWDIYSDVPDGTAPYEFTFGTDQCGGSVTYDSEGDCFNREHSFPQSWFGGVPGPDTDLFHMYPTDAWVNQKRANWPYGTVGNNVTFAAENGGKLGQCTYPGCSGLAFEPIDAYKGDLARGYFYMLTRYMNEANGWADAPVLSGGEFLPWVENLLLEWHTEDPVSAKEVARNNTIFTNLQHNRNPYIDHPEWVASIWGPFASIEDRSATSPRVWFDGDGLRVERVKTTGFATVSVFNASGALVTTSKVQDRSAVLALDTAPGLYVVLVDDGMRSVTRVVR
ncbi:MAG: endonuclease [Flavobacteriales bacterium]|nr:endonuclease [Flavobacteriales bacterium]